MLPPCVIFGLRLIMLGTTSMIALSDPYLGGAGSG